MLRGSSVRPSLTPPTEIEPALDPAARNPSLSAVRRVCEAAYRPDAISFRSGFATGAISSGSNSIFAQRRHDQADEQEWLSALIRWTAPVIWFAMDDAARLWQVERPAAERRLWVLEHGGLVENMRTNQAQQRRWRVAPVAHPILAVLAPG
jgi:hypothetical protein